MTLPTLMLVGAAAVASASWRWGFLAWGWGMQAGPFGTNGKSRGWLALRCEGAFGLAGCEPVRGSDWCTAASQLRLGPSFLGPLAASRAAWAWEAGAGAEPDSAKAMSVGTGGESDWSHHRNVVSHWYLMSIIHNQPFVYLFKTNDH